MIKPIFECNHKISPEMVENLMDVLEMRLPPMTDSVFYGLVVLIAHKNRMSIRLHIYDDGARTKWEIELEDRKIRHRGYDDGCEWTEWEEWT